MKVGDFMIFEDGITLEQYLLAERPQDNFHLRIITGERGLFEMMRYLYDSEEILKPCVVSETSASFLSGRWLAEVEYNKKLDTTGMLHDRGGHNDSYRFFVFVMRPKTCYSDCTIIEMEE